MPAYTSFTIAGPGNLGGHIAKALLKQGFKVSVLSRSGSSANAKTLEAAGANIQAVDYSDASSVAEALAGSQVVINTLGIAALQGSAQDILIEQSKKAGVQLYVPNDWGFSYDFAEKSGVSIHPFIHAKTTVEAQLEKIGLPYLHIFNGHLGQHLASLFSVDKEARTAKIVGAGNTAFVTTALQDVGEFVGKAFAALPRKELENASLCVSASPRFTANELFAQVEKRDGKPWKIEHTSLQVAKAASSDLSLGRPSFFNWIAYAIDQGAANSPDDNDRVGFQPSVDIVDLILGPSHA